jgi:iron complex outermembrane receptor protein
MSWSAGFDWKVTPDVLAYIKSSNASRAGGQNLRGLGLVTTDLNGNAIAPINTFQPFDPETVTDIEVGMKGQFFDHSLQVNTAYYHMWYTDVQKTALLPTPTGLTTFISNTSKATYDGVEIEAKWVITDQWMLQANAGLINWAYENSADFSPSVPDKEYSVRLNFRQPTDIGDINFDVNYSYRGEMYPSSSATRQDLVAHPAAMIDDVGLVGARVALDLEQYGVTVAVWGQNLTDEEYTLSPLVLSTAANLYATGLGVPRTYGLDATYKF